MCLVEYATSGESGGCERYFESCSTPLIALAYKVYMRTDIYLHLIMAMKENTFWVHRK